MSKSTFQESLSTAIESCAYRFTDLHPHFHDRSIAMMPDRIHRKMATSEHHVYRSEEEGLVWVVKVDFPISATDMEDLEEYAIGIYESTRITLIRVAYKGVGWNLNVDPSTLRVGE